MSVPGTIYIVHLSAPLHHARHYVGFVEGGAENVPLRLARHRRGDGSRLLRAVAAAGIGFDVVRTFPGTRDDERRLKREKKIAPFCPVCSMAPRQPAHLRRCEPVTVATKEVIPF